MDFAALPNCDCNQCPRRWSALVARTISKREHCEEQVNLLARLPVRLACLRIAQLAIDLTQRLAFASAAWTTSGSIKLTMPEPSSEDANPSARSRLQRARRRFGQTADLNCLAEALALGEIAPGDDKDFRLDRLWELEEYAYAVDAVLCRPFLIDSFVASYPAWRRRLNMVIELLRAWCLDSSLPAQALAFCLDARSSYDQNGTGASIADILEAWANHCAFLWVAQPPDASESAALDLRILQAASRSLRLRLQQYGIPQNPYDMLKRVRNREPAVIPDHYAKELATLIEACRNALHKLADTHETLSMHTWRFTALLEYRLTPSDVDEIIQVTRRGARAPNSPIHFRFTNASHNALWISAHPCPEVYQATSDWEKVQL